MEKIGRDTVLSDIIENTKLADKRSIKPSKKSNVKKVLKVEIDFADLTVGQILELAFDTAWIAWQNAARRVEGKVEELKDSVSFKATPKNVRQTKDPVERSKSDFQKMSAEQKYKYLIEIGLPKKEAEKISGFKVVTRKNGNK